MLCVPIHTAFFLFDLSTMKITLKLEEVFMFILSLFLFYQLESSWWLFSLFFLLPDIGMLGYLMNEKIGSISYNLLHHKGIALMILLLGYGLNHKELQFAGIIIFSHASFDRIFGYGLKYKHGFKSTHLGEIGNNQSLDKV